MAKRRNGEGSWGVKTINGKKYKRFRSPEGKDFYGKTQKEANQKYLTWKEQNKDIDLSKGTLTLYQYAQQWLKSTMKHVKSTTYDGYEYFVEHVLKSDNCKQICNQQIRQITKRDLQICIDSWADTLPLSSIKKFKTLLGQIFKSAKRDKIISENVMEDVKTPIAEKIVKETKAPVFLSRSDMDKLNKERNRKYPNGTPIYGANAQVVVFIMNTGLRISEAVALRWGDVNLQEGYIYVRNNAPIIKNRAEDAKTKYILDNTTPKRKASYRQIPLSDAAYDCLQYFNTGLHKDGDFVFCSKTGQPIQRRNVNRTLLCMLKSADCECKDASPHDLRHTFGSELIRNGIDVKVVSELLGHKDIQTTYNIYIHILQSQKTDAIQVLNRKS